MGADALRGAGEKARSIVVRGRRRVTASPVGRHGDVHVAFLGDTHHSHGRGHAQGYAGGNGAALVEDHARMHVVLAQPRHGVVCGGAGGLLAARREEPYVARGNVTLGQQVLERLHAAAEAELVVERAASPNLAVVDLGGEGRVRPLLAVRGHHVVVGHHHDGRQ